MKQNHYAMYRHIFREYTYVWYKGIMEYILYKL